MYQNPQRPVRTKPWQRIKSILHELNRHACQRTVYCVLDYVQLYSSNFSAHQRHCVKIQRCLERCQHAHFIRYLCHLLTIIKQRLKDPRIVERSDREFPFAKMVKEELSNPAFVQDISMDGQRCSENLAILLCSRLLQREVLTFQD